MQYKNINLTLPVLLATLVIFLLQPASGIAQEVKLDGIAAVVDDGIVLQSELNEKLNDIKAQLRAENIELPPEELLQKQVLERLIIMHLQLQQAEQRGIKIDDISLNKTLRQMATKNGISLEQFRQELIKNGINYLQYREDLRKDIIIKRLTRSVVNRRVVISEQEIEDYLANAENINQNSEYLISHIEVSIPEAANPEKIQNAEKKINNVYAQLKEGADFAALAIAESDGRRALDGGDLGWRKLNQLPSLFAKEIRNLKTGKFSKPIRTPRGFHIILLRDTKGIKQYMVKQVHAQHILMTTNTLLDDEKVRAKLSEIRQQVIENTDFGELAKKHSEDISSATNGGDLGWTEPGAYVDEFRKIIETLPINRISEPFKTRYGWHIVKVLGRRDYDKTVEYRQEQARRNLFKRKAAIEEELWIRRLRDQAYVEYRLGT